MKTKRNKHIFFPPSWNKSVTRYLRTTKSGYYQLQVDVQNWEMELERNNPENMDWYSLNCDGDMPLFNLTNRNKKPCFNPTARDMFNGSQTFNYE